MEKDRETRPEKQENRKPGRWRIFFRRWLRQPMYSLLRVLALSLLMASVFLYGFYRYNSDEIWMLVGDVVQDQAGRLFAPQTTFSRMLMPSPGKFIFHDFRIADPFDPRQHFIEARRIEVTIDPLRLIWRGINLSRLSIESASVRIHRGSLEGKFNIERLFREGEKKPDEENEAPKPAGSGLRVRIKEFRLDEVAVLLEDIDDQPINNVARHLRGSFTRIDGENVVEVIESRLVTDYEDIGLVAFSGVVTFGDGNLGFPTARVRKGQTDLTCSGWIDFDEDTWSCEIAPGSRLDLSHLPEELGLDGMLIGTVGLSVLFSGTFDSTFIRSEISLERGTLFDYPVKDLSTVLTYDADRLRFDRVRSGIAGGGLEGEIEFVFDPAEEGYRAVIQARDIDLRRLKFDWSRDLEGRMSGNLELRGSGYDEHEMMMEIMGRSLSGRMFEVPIDSSRIDYTLRGGHSRIENLALYSEGASATAIGDINADSIFLFVLVEQFRAERLARWFPVEGLSGEADFAGSLSGSPGDPALKGTFGIHDGTYEEMAFAGMEGSCELWKLVTGINGSFEVRLGDLSLSGYDLRSLRVSAVIPDSGAIRFDPLVAVKDSLNILYCTGYYLPGEVGDEHHISLDSLNLLYAGRRAVSLDTIRVYRRPDTTSFEGLRLSALGGSIRGRIDLVDDGWFDSGIEFEDLDLSRLPEEFNPGFPLSGRAGGAMHLEGETGQPSGTVILSVENPSFSILTFDRLDGSLRISQQALEIDSLRLFTADAFSMLNGRIPLDRETPEGSAVPPGEEIALHVRLDSFPLTAIRSTTIPFSAGRIDGEVDILGSRDKPLVSGEVRLGGGEGLIAPINTRLQNMTGRLVFEPGVLKLVDLVSTSPEGRITVSGRIPLDGLLPDSLDIRAIGREMVLQQFKYVTSLRVNLDMNLQGPVAKPSLNGTVRVIEGEVNPAFGGAQEGVATDISAPQELRLPVMPFDFDVRFTAQDNFWLRNRNSGIRLTMDIRASQRDSLPAVSGQINTVTGYYSVFGRRFQVRFGSIQFQGRSVINPLLDINAERTVRGRVLRSDFAGYSYGLRGSTSSAVSGEQYEMDVNIFALNIGGTLNNPQFEISVLDQNRREIEPPITPEMARTLVLVDQTHREFNQQSGMSQSKLLDQAANMALNQANPYLQEWTGLDEFSIESQLFTRGAGEDQSSDRAGARLTMGEFLFDKIFFSFSQDLLDPSARSAQIEYLINRNSSIIGQTDSRGHFSVDFRYLIKY